MEQQSLHSLFAIAQTDIRTTPFNNHSRTLRLVIHPNVDAYAVSVRFANYYAAGPLPVGAASLALCDANGQLEADTLVPLTVGGLLSFSLDADTEVISDAVRFPIKPGQPFALNLYYPTEERVVSGNWIGSGALRSRPGNFSADIELPGPGLVSRFARTLAASDMTVATTNVAEVIAHRETPGRVLACFGDSITQQGNWTFPLEKLLHHRYPGEISICNLGISGNRLLHGPAPATGGLFGEAGIIRFERDVLRLNGLTHCIIGLGSNDLGHPGSEGVSESELPTLPQYTEALEGLAGQLHQRGVKSYVSTIAPRAIDPPYDEPREALRQEMNAWIRSAPCFDAVLDFDAVLRREDGNPGIREGCVLPDGLHPNPYGGLWMAKSIDLSLFGGDDDG